MERAALTAGMLLAVLALYLLMLKGWRARQRRQGDLPPPPVPPAEPGQVLVDAVPGLFVGTTSADDWLDRVAVHDLGHRSAGFLLVDTDGVHVEREGLPELYLPFADIDAVSVGDALAGKVVGREGLLLVDWRLGGRPLTSGFRADDHGAHRRLVEAVGARIGTAGTGPDRPALDRPAPDRPAPDGLDPARPSPSPHPPTSSSTARLDLEAP